MTLRKSKVSTRGQAKLDKEPSDTVRTPHWLCDWIAHHALGGRLDLRFEDEPPFKPVAILDPCCGDGRMIQAMKPYLIEGDAPVQFDLEGDPPINFLLAEPDEALFDLIVMNPPFSNLGVVKFIKQALKFLKPNGEIFCISPNYIFDNADSRKPWLFEHLKELYLLPIHAFKPEAPTLHASLLILGHPMQPFPNARTATIDFIPLPKNKAQLEIT